MCNSRAPKPRPVAPSPAPEQVDPAVQSAGLRERRRARIRQGVQSTIIAGQYATPVTSAVKTLLGS
jgi:hypothetical protein